VFLIASLGMGVFAITQGWVRPQLIQTAVLEAGPWGMVAYVCGVVLLELLWVPRAWGLVAGGALFGPLVGGLLSLVADSLGALLCYLLGRGGGREWVKELLSRRPRVASVVTLLAERRGGLTVAALRVMPVAHFTAVSYAAGVGGVRFGAFLWGNSLGILPGAFLYPFIGNAALTPTSPTFLISAALVVVAFIASVFVARWYLGKHAGSG
jgi:uncharacterized membrane protein YdjX (TVP38/TMEM64 family)